MYRIAPGSKAFAITPNDSDDLAEAARAVYIGTGGNVTCILADDSSSVLFTAISSGTMLPIRVKKVFDTGTTASDIVGIV
jgi:hypothetical protein